MSLNSIQIKILQEIKQDNPILVRTMYKHGVGAIEFSQNLRELLHLGYVCFYQNKYIISKAGIHLLEQLATPDNVSTETAKPELCTHIEPTLTEPIKKFKCGKQGCGAIQTIEEMTATLEQMPAPYAEGNPNKLFNLCVFHYCKDCGNGDFEEVTQA